MSGSQQQLLYKTIFSDTFLRLGYMRNRKDFFLLINIERNCRTVVGYAIKRLS